MIYSYLLRKLKENKNLNNQEKHNKSISLYDSSKTFFIMNVVWICC